MERKNNKGFSMIELLAVIAIIGILAGLAAMAYGRHLENTRRNAFENMATTLYEATKSYFLVNSGDLPNVGQPFHITGEKLIENGFLEALTSPRNDRFDCNKSVITVTRKGDSTDGFNMALEYTVVINCGPDNTKEVEFIFPRQR